MWRRRCRSWRDTGSAPSPTGRPSLPVAAPPLVSPSSSTNTSTPSSPPSLPFPLPLSLSSRTLRMEERMGRMGERTATTLRSRRAQSPPTTITSFPLVEVDVTPKTPPPFSLPFPLPVRFLFLSSNLLLSPLDLLFIISNPSSSLSLFQSKEADQREGRHEVRLQGRDHRTLRVEFGNRVAVLDLFSPLPSLLSSLLLLLFPSSPHLSLGPGPVPGGEKKGGPGEGLGVEGEFYDRERKRMSSSMCAIHLLIPSNLLLFPSLRIIVSFVPSYPLTGSCPFPLWIFPQHYFCPRFMHH